MPFAATWMDLKGIMLSEVSPTEKDKYCMISLIHGVQKIQQTNEILPFAATWMDLESIMLSEKSQTEKDKYCMISAI